MDFSLNRSFVLILLNTVYRVSKVIRKHTKLNHNHSVIVLPMTHHM